MNNCIPNMRRIIFGVWAIVQCGCILTFAMPVNPKESEIQPDKLLQSSFILVGRLDSIRESGKTVFDRYGLGTPIDVAVHEASIKVLQILQGEPSANIRITNIFSSVNPDENVGLQALEKNTNYVFFLSGNPNGTDFAPISPYKFALKTITPGANNSAAPKSLKESLAVIAKENIAVINNPAAESWAQYLQGQYDSNRDLAFWTNAATDPRIAIRGIALVILSEKAPNTPQLYSAVIKFIEAGDGKFTDLDRLCSFLPKLAGKSGFSAEQINAWLGGKSKRLNNVALKWIQNKKEESAMAEVAHLMTSSQDRDIQYECIRTLCDLTGDIHLIAYPIFMQQPDKYVAEWQKIAQKLEK